MTAFRVERTSALSASEAWRRLTDWPAHGRHVPLTRLSVTPSGPTRLGTLVLARTGVGPLRFDDPMEVVVWRPPAEGGSGHCRLDKRGALVRGWAEIRVRESGGVTRVLWQEDIRLALLPRVCDAPTAWLTRPVFAHAVDGLLRG